MSWGTELWDQFDSLAHHTHKGIDFCERYSRFVKERCDIENEYAAKLKKLVKNYQPKKKEEEDFAFTSTQGFLGMINEVHDMAGQHEMITENLLGSVHKDLTSLIHECKTERKKCLQEYTKLQTLLQNQQLSLEKSKKQYEKSFREAEKAQEAYKKADADIHLSRAEVEKAKNLMHNRLQYSEECKKEYAGELQKTNQVQREHFDVLSPQIFQTIQDFEAKRIKNIQNCILQSATIERNVVPIINTCIDGIQKSAQSIDLDKDHQMVIDRFKSGFQPPVDIPFEDLSNGNTLENNGGHMNTPKNTLRQDTMKGTQGSGKGKKRGGIFGIFSSSKLPTLKDQRYRSNGMLRVDESKEDYSHLPPTQQRKKILQKIDKLKHDITTSTAERDGMLKMRDVYVQNTALGDPATLDQQLEENAQSLDKLKQELQKFEGYLAGCDNRGTNLETDAQIGRKMSDLSVSSNQTGSHPSTPVQSHQQIAKESPDSGVGHTQSPQLADQDSFDELDDDFPIIGMCRAVYQFEATNEGSIAMNEGEELSIVEADQGDGWTRVRRENGDEGFVPTSYIQTNFYENA